MKEQILIVDDEHYTVELLRYNLEKENYGTLVARNGEEAIDAVQCHAPDLVLLDVMMPELNGWETCRILRESSKGGAVPIIMLTAISDEEARIKGLALGADDYVTKPFSVRELLLKVRKCLDRQRKINLLRTKGQEMETSLRYMVHEVRNSLSVIGGYSSLALKKDDPRKHLGTITAAAVHAASLLNDVSLLARLEKKESGSLSVEPIDIVAVTKDAVDMALDAAKKKRIEIAVMKSTPSPVWVHRTGAKQVLINLLTNAVKYGREGGRVWIYFDERNGWTDVSVKDEGCGILPDELHRIFDKFYRAAGSEQVKGAGLGLYIVKLLTEGMGGKINVVSERGTGSTFTASFPEANVTHNSIQVVA